jgi:hypothetical protein
MTRIQRIFADQTKKIRADPSHPRHPHSFLHFQQKPRKLTESFLLEADGGFGHQKHERGNQ